MENTLFLRLEGPLQSWGERGRWSVRDSATEPTKSAVVGLLACALGFNKDEKIRNLSQSIQVGIRCDREGFLMQDYHTIGGGYPTPQLRQADGKAKKGHTELSYRTYLQDASFLVAIQTDAIQLPSLVKATTNPHWCIYLGRKSCPPSRPIYEGIGRYESCEAALEAWPWYCPKIEKDSEEADSSQVKENEESVRAVLQSSALEGGVRRRHEIQSRSLRTFGPYYTQDKPLTIKVIPDFPPMQTISEKGDTPCTSPA